MTERPKTRPRRTSKAALLLLLAVVCTSFAPGVARRPAAFDPEVVAIVGATVVDGTGAEAFPATVLIKGERIAAVGRDVEVPAGARVVRAEGHTLLPGLFDLHTHLPYATAPGLLADWPKNLKAYLFCGVTSVVDFGTYPETFEPMRRLISSGAAPGPRVHFAARLTTPGGHGAEGGRGDFFTLEVQTPREARAAVRRLLPYKPDVLKVFTDGWRYDAAPDMTSMNEETLAAICDEAHRHGLKVLTHTVTLARAKTAARAGVDVLAHGVGDAEADEELARLLKANNTTYVSTLAVYEPRGRDILSPLLLSVLEPLVRDAFDPPLTTPTSPDLPTTPSATLPVTSPQSNTATGDANEANRTSTPSETPPVRPAHTPVPVDRASTQTQTRGARARRWRNLLHNVSALRRAGVSLGAGTDAGVTGTHHGWATLRELRLMVAGGLTPLEALTAATGASARALGVERERGRVAVGQLADLLLVEGEPHRRIEDIERVARVFLGGRELDRQQLARDISVPELTPLAAARAARRVDDFEAVPDSGTEPGALRSPLGTLWLNATDPGQDHSQVLLGRTLRRPGNHALSVLARMSYAARPYARAALPLSRGGVEPVDARRFRGVSFDARGDGEYRLLVPTRAARGGSFYQTRFRATGEWKKVKIPFDSLAQLETTRPAPWTGADLLALVFEIERRPGETGWLELDDIRFYE